MVLAVPHTRLRLGERVFTAVCRQTSGTQLHCLPPERNSKLSCFTNIYRHYATLFVPSKPNSPTCFVRSWSGQFYAVSSIVSN